MALVTTDTENDTCHHKHFIDGNKSQHISAVMFAMGIFGNVAALVILEIRRRRQRRSGGSVRRSLFNILITSLVVTDLTGTCLVSPLVQLSYSSNTTLVGMMPESRSVCSFFGLSMTFFSLATMSLLFITALEKCFAISYPYLYSRHVTNKCAYITIPLVFLLCTLFCLVPFAGFGKYVQYCPGTWCFIDMNPSQKEDRAYAILYATVMLVMVLVIVTCNGFVVYQLLRMYQRRVRNGSIMANMRSTTNTDRRVMSMVEEGEHLAQLVFMTIIFVICTLPLVIRVYINSLQVQGESHSLDLVALRFLSINSIIDPWVFILLSPSMLHFFRASLCKTPLGASRAAGCKSSLVKQNSPPNVELCQPTLCTDVFHSVENI